MAGRLELLAFEAGGAIALARGKPSAAGTLNGHHPVTPVGI
jgi:hypothetical protein